MTIDMLESLSRLRPLNEAETLQLYWLVKQEKKRARRHFDRENAVRRARYASDPEYAERRRRENAASYKRRTQR